MIGPRRETSARRAGWQIRPGARRRAVAARPCRPASGPVERVDAAWRIRAAAEPHGGQVNAMPAARFLDRYWGQV
jgi:hypothetical protein